MNAATFLTRLGAVLAKSRMPEVVQSAVWTRFMKDNLLDLAEEAAMHVCAEGLGRIGPDINRHQSKEYLFDFTIYDEQSWQAWSLPSIIVEHENNWSEEAFLADCWKLLLGFAPLRVMIGYGRNRPRVDALAKRLLSTADESRWQYPDGVEDLVLLRSPISPSRAEGMRGRTGGSCTDARSDRGPTSVIRRWTVATSL